MKTAEIHTSKGIIEVSFFEEDAPVTVDNFIKLAKKGYYDNTIFHRVIPTFVIQGGDPTGTGGGGPGYTIPDEVTGNNQYHDRGILSMAKTSAPNSGGSQFFICLSREATKHLDRVHTCFGKLIKGEEFINSIKQGDKIEKIVVNEEPAL